jgi:hypothetical protein
VWSTWPRPTVPIGDGTSGYIPIKEFVWFLNDKHGRREAKRWSRSPLSGTGGEIGFLARMRVSECLFLNNCVIQRRTPLPRPQQRSPLMEADEPLDDN